MTGHKEFSPKSRTGAPDNPEAMRLDHLMALVREATASTASQTREVGGVLRVERPPAQAAEERAHAKRAEKRAPGKCACMV